MSGVVNVEPNMEQHQYLLLIMLLEKTKHLNLNIDCCKHSLLALLLVNLISIEIFLSHNFFNLIAF
jgi:hypothetical protein